MTTDRITEPARNLPVTDRFDVVVAGGGIAGVAAAVAAARNDAKVLLLEKNCALGGLATLGNVIIWLPICDGMGRQVMAGLPEELLKLSVADLGSDHPNARFMGIPKCWLPGGDPGQRKNQRYRTEFNPSAYLLALEELVVEAGVDLLYDSRVCDVKQQGERITHVIVENKSGRSAVACRTVVDATGDADLCYIAGESTESLDTNVLTAWFYHLQRDGLHLHQMSKRYDPDAGVDASGPLFRGDHAGQITEQLLGSRRLMHRLLEQIRRDNPDEDIQLIMPATIPCLRMTRRLQNSFSLGKRHMHEWLDDAVGLTGDWRHAGPVYAVPYRAIAAERNCNLLTAGRCISADTSIWDATRAIPTCALTGHAAGTAAAMAAAHDGNARTLPVPKLQAKLKEQGALIDPELVKPAE